MVPPSIIDYLVVHELAHLRESNYTQEFWSLVSERDPDYRTHAVWLDEYRVQLTSMKQAYSRALGALRRRQIPRGGSSEATNHGVDNQ